MIKTNFNDYKLSNACKNHIIRMLYKITFVNNYDIILFRINLDEQYHKKTFVQ